MDLAILLAIAKIWLGIGTFLTFFVWFIADRFLPWLIIGWPFLIFALLEGRP